MSTNTTTKKYPAPVYAAAAAGELAYKQLRKLPGRLVELRERVATNDLDLRADLARFSKTAQRNAAAMLDEARNVYAGLVARGEKVVEGERGGKHATAKSPEIGATPAKATKRTARTSGN
jgi:hypothetical protein